ncbi:hypothetical protein [Natranaerobius trueperi]|nr:hypothetical protein [Natranaerobius trueperi]
MQREQKTVKTGYPCEGMVEPETDNNSKEFKISLQAGQVILPLQK